MSLPMNTSPDNRERLRRLIKERSLLSGDFTLASGDRSQFFFDMKKTMLHPEGAALIADALFAIARQEKAVRFLGGLELGAVPIIATVCMRSWPDQPLGGFIVRKEKKGRGTDKLIEGNIEPRSAVILFEDVTTTGESVMQAVRAVRDLGCTIARIVTIVDRLAGAEKNLRAEGLELTALYTKDDFAA